MNPTVITAAETAAKIRDTTIGASIQRFSNTLDSSIYIPASSMSSYRSAKVTARPKRIKTSIPRATDVIQWNTSSTVFADFSTFSEDTLIL